jgi:uncharacterized membrane protein (UPF0127 family)
LAGIRWRVVNERSGAVVGTSIAEASGSWQSFRGLMFLKNLPPGHGLLFRPARGIHTHFMRFPIDLVYLDKTNHVVKTNLNMVPWRFDFTVAHAVIELAAGTVQQADIRPDDQLVFEATDV